MRAHLVAAAGVMNVVSTRTCDPQQLRQPERRGFNASRAGKMDVPAPRRAALRRTHAHALHECTPVKSKLTKRMEQIKLRIIRVLQFVY